MFWIIVSPVYMKKNQISNKSAKNNTRAKHNSVNHKHWSDSLLFNIPLSDWSGFVKRKKKRTWTSWFAEKRKAEFLTVGEVHQAMFWPIVELTERIYGSC